MPVIMTNFILPLKKRQNGRSKVQNCWQKRSWIIWIADFIGSCMKESSLITQFKSSSCLLRNHRNVVPFLIQNYIYQKILVILIIIIEYDNWSLILHQDSHCVAALVIQAPLLEEGRNVFKPLLGLWILLDLDCEDSG